MSETAANNSPYLLLRIMLYLKKFGSVLLLLLAVKFVSGFCRCNPAKDCISTFKVRKSVAVGSPNSPRSNIIYKEKTFSLSARNQVAPIDKYGKLKDTLARSVGYVMGTGAMLIYAPILIKIIRRGNADGFALATWVYNVLGMSLAVAYPVKKGFPVSTYLELLAAFAQSVVILVLIAFYQGRLFEASTGIISLVAILIAFVKSKSVPPKMLSAVQIAAMLIANYANVPQILLSFQNKSASWSGITALMSLAGCFVRILTTLQLTKDGLVVAGYMLGLVTNGILLGQVLVYGQA